MISAFSRLSAGLALCAAIGVALLASPAFSQSPEQARQTLQTAINRVLADIKNPDYVNPATRGPLRRQIEDEVYHVFDFSEFSSRTVGPRWKTFSEDVKKRFSEAFANLLFNTYLNKITGYNGEQVDYTGEMASPDGKRVEIRTILTMKDGKKTPVNYRMLYKDGGWHVYDVIIENISLVQNYRTQFSDILNTATPEQLIERINAKAKEVIAQGSEGK